ncbi:VWA domain-containing protein [Dyella terrae]|nr:VWA domain-containing protein [Dyella terrae]
MSIPDLFGTHTVNPSADLDEGMLRSIATQTGGHYFRATDSKQLAEAYRAIDALEPMPQQGPSLRPRHELFRWPLAFAVAVWLLAFVPRTRRREAFA